MLGASSTRARWRQALRAAAEWVQLRAAQALSLLAAAERWVALQLPEAVVEPQLLLQSPDPQVPLQGRAGLPRLWLAAQLRAAPGRASPCLPALGLAVLHRGWAHKRARARPSAAVLG